MTRNTRRSSKSRAIAFNLGSPQNDWSATRHHPLESRPVAVGIIVSVSAGSARFFPNTDHSSALRRHPPNWPIFQRNDGRQNLRWFRWTQPTLHCPVAHSCGHSETLSPSQCKVVATQNHFWSSTTRHMSCPANPAPLMKQTVPRLVQNRCWQ